MAPTEAFQDSVLGARQMLRFLFSIPILPFGNPSGRGVFVNRRNPYSHWISPNDIGLNFSDWFATFSGRIPDGAFLVETKGTISEGRCIDTALAVEETVGETNGGYFEVFAGYDAGSDDYAHWRRLQ